MRHSLTIEDHLTKTGGRTDGGNCGVLAVALVESEQLVDIEVANAISIGQHKWLVADELADSFDPPAGLGVLTGVEQMDGPVFAIGIVDLDFTITQADGQAASSDRSS